MIRHEAQSTTNLGSSAIWTTNSLAHVVVNGEYTVTNPVSGSDHLLVTNVEAGTISLFDDGGSFLGNLQDPSGQQGPSEPVLARVDSLLATPISLNDDEFRWLVDFVGAVILTPKQIGPW